MSRALLIDDEVSARRDLRSLLGAHPEVTIVGEAALIDEARALLRGGNYDLVFLDIQLLGGTGFDLVPDVRPGARIIFVTAFDQFAFRAFEVNALDYLRKPLRTARLAEALARLPPPAAAAENPAPGPGSSAQPPLALTDLVSVKTGPGALRFVPVADLVAITSSDNYSELHLSGARPLLVRESLAAWEARLPASHFLRVHRQTIVNVACIAGYENDTAEIALLRVTGLAGPVRARRQHWDELRTRLAALGRAL